MTELCVRVLALLLVPSAAMCLTPTPSRTPDPSARACVGDCDGSGVVTLSEVVTCINSALNDALSPRCVACDGNRDGRVGIGELQGAVSAVLGGCSLSDAFEPDDSIAQARRVSCGTEQLQALLPSGDSDWTHLTLDRLSGVALSTSGAIGDPTMTLYDAVGSALEYNDDAVSLFPSIRRFCGNNALPAGEYFIEMRGLGASVVPEYTLSVTCEPCSVNNPSATPTQGPDAYEPDNEPALAGSIECGTVQVRNFAPNGNDQDWVEFTLASLSTVHVLTLDRSGSGSTIELYDADRLFNGYLEYGYGSLQRDCGIDALEAGTYVVHLPGYPTSGYDLGLICTPCGIPNPTATPTPTVPPPPTSVPTDAAEEDDSRAQAAPITCGAPCYGPWPRSGTPTGSPSSSPSARRSGSGD